MRYLKMAEMGVLPEPVQPMAMWATRPKEVALSPLQKDAVLRAASRPVFELLIPTQLDAFRRTKRPTCDELVPEQLEA
jgi:hypothetical protein